MPVALALHDGDLVAGERDEAVGSFLAILWENLADPILSGRDELGFSKLWCEIPPPIVLNGRHSYRALWLEHTFFDLELRDVVELPPAPVAKPTAAAGRNDGTLHFKYVPKTGSWGESEVAYAALTPNTGSKLKVNRIFKARGHHSLRRSTWEQLPTMFHIVNALADLPMVEYRSASIVDSQGGKDLGDQKRLA